MNDADCACQIRIGRRLYNGNQLFLPVNAEPAGNRNSVGRKHTRPVLDRNATRSRPLQPMGCEVRCKQRKTGRATS